MCCGGCNRIVFYSTRNKFADAFVKALIIHFCTFVSNPSDGSKNISNQNLLLSYLLSKQDLKEFVHFLN